MITPKERAIRKTKSEINKDISKLIEMAKLCGYGELKYFMHYLHFLRLSSLKETPESKKVFINIYSENMTDVCKYIIQIVAKYCQNGHVGYRSNNLLINFNLTRLMTDVTLGINSKFEALSNLTMFTNVEVIGERDQHIRMNLEEITKNERQIKFLYYGFRFSKENNYQKENSKQTKNFVNHFREEYTPYSDLFAKEFGVSIDEFISLHEWILETITSQIEVHLEKYIYLKEDIIDINAYQTIMQFGSDLFLKKQIVYNNFGLKFDKILNRITFQSSIFDEKELKYNQIARQPIIEKGDSYIISPELLLDSLFVNCHYSLLEASQQKEEYKKRNSENFVSKILSIAKEFGFEEFGRELELYEGKNQIGDLDLIVKNKDEEFLIIEAKNHAVPMDVYFHDQEATEKRLTLLKDEWEKKVLKRQKHLELYHSKYGISPTFKYIIVSKTPEILSHFSDYLVLSLTEFRYWLKTNNLDTKFEEIFNSLYNLNVNPFTSEQLDILQRDLSPGWRFDEE